jgi:hypothetical protein
MLAIKTPNCTRSRRMPEVSQEFKYQQAIPFGGAALAVYTQ